MILRIDGMRFSYNGHPVLHDVTFEVGQGDLVAVLGPNGVGKSTLLRSVNRLNDLIDSVRIEGDMLLAGDSIYGKSVDVIEESAKRVAGLVQELANLICQGRKEFVKDLFWKLQAYGDYDSDPPSDGATGDYGLVASIEYSW